MALRLLLDLILSLDEEEEKERPWEAEEDFELDVGSFDEDWVELSSAFGSGIGGRPFSITKYL